MKSLIWHLNQSCDKDVPESKFPAKPGRKNSWAISNNLSKELFLIDSDAKHFMYFNHASHFCLHTGNHDNAIYKPTKMSHE